MTENSELIKPNRDWISKRRGNSSYRASSSLIISLLLLCGCIPSNQVTPTLSPLEPTGVNATSTNTLLTATARSTVTAIPSPTSIPPSATTAPTLTATERSLLIIELLRTNAGCSLPCWWGITPSTTTWLETEKLISRMGASTSIYSETDGLFHHSTGGFNFDDLQIYHEIAFFERAGTIESILVAANSYGEREEFHTMWDAYSPNRVILNYGRPSRVWMQSISSAHEGSLRDFAPYDFWLFYDDLGFLLRYEGLTQFEPRYLFCPVFGDNGNLASGLEIYLQSPNSQYLLEDLVGERMGAIETIRSLGDVTNLTIMELSYRLIQNDQPPCFEAQRELWPN